MKRVKINTPYDATIQVPSAIFKEQKQKEIDDILKRSDQLAESYFNSCDNSTSMAHKDKQMSGFGLTLFDRGYEIVTYVYSRNGREFVAQYERSLWTNNKLY